MNNNSVSLANIVDISTICCMHNTDPTITRHAIGKLIREARRNKFPRMTQLELGVAAFGDKEKQSRISHYERGIRQPSLQDLQLIANALGVDLVDFISAADVGEMNELIDPEISSCLAAVTPEQRMAVLMMLRSMVSA